MGETSNDDFFCDQGLSKPLQRMPANYASCQCGRCGPPASLSCAVSPHAIRIMVKALACLESAPAF